MISTSIRGISKLTFIAIAALLISGCGVTLSPVKRKPLQFSAPETSLHPMPQKFLVQFDSTLPGQPLAETVWDNVSGAFGNAEESKQIGFMQDYATLIPATAGGGVAAGMAVATRPEYTRIVIPFGRIFETVFKSGLRTAFPNSRTSSNASGESDQLWTASAQTVKLMVVDFKVWEQPLNHLNLEATVKCEVYLDPNSDKPESEFETHHEMLNQSLGSVMSTSTGFIREMNKISNRFAGVLSENILEQLQKAFAEQEAQPASGK